MQPGSAPRTAPSSVQDSTRGAAVSSRGVTQNTELPRRMDSPLTASVFPHTWVSWINHHPQQHPLLGKAVPSPGRPYCKQLLPVPPQSSPPSARSHVPPFLRRGPRHTDRRWMLGAACPCQGRSFVRGLRHGFEEEENEKAAPERNGRAAAARPGARPGRFTLRARGPLQAAPGKRSGPPGRAAPPRSARPGAAARPARGRGPAMPPPRRGPESPQRRAALQLPTAPAAHSSATGPGGAARDAGRARPPPAPPRGLHRARVPPLTCSGPGREGGRGERAAASRARPGGWRRRRRRRAAARGRAAAARGSAPACSARGPRRPLRPHR